MKPVARQLSILVILLYLLIPLAAHAASTIPVSGSAVVLYDSGLNSSNPCSDCPCGDEQGSDCCGATVCGCAFHSPPEQNILVRYSPEVAALQYSERTWYLPQVYQSIFVPPQNSTAAAAVGRGSLPVPVSG